MNEHDTSQICQSCHQNPAELTVSFRRGGDQWDVHLCAACAQRMRRHTEQAMREYHRQLLRTAAGGGAMPRIAWPGGEDAPAAPLREPGEGELERLRARRELQELRARLEDAVRGEHYEDAARLRDQIHSKEKEARAYDGK